MGKKFATLAPLRASETLSKATARVRIVRSFVGGAAYLHELISGKPSSNDGKRTPHNPQADLGVDLSGPPWGSAIRHPIAWAGGQKADPAVAFGQGSVCRCSAGVRAIVGPWLIWNRPFESLPAPYKAPYSLGEIALRGHAGAADAAVVQVDVRNQSITRGPMAFSGNNDITTSASTTEEVLSPTLFIPLVAGWNILEIGFLLVDATLDDYFIDSVVVNQVQKRSH